MNKTEQRAYDQLLRRVAELEAELAAERGPATDETYAWLDFFGKVPLNSATKYGRTVVTFGKQDGMAYWVQYDPQRDTLEVMGCGRSAGYLAIRLRSGNVIELVEDAR